MRLSEIKPDNLVVFARLGETIDDVEDKEVLQPILTAAQQYVLTYTGLDKTAADAHEDLTVAALVLAADMYENRIFSVESREINPIAARIMNIHSVNLL
jgi:hypothetical protein